MVDKTDKNTRNLEALLDELEETSPGSTFTTDANGPSLTRSSSGWHGTDQVSGLATRPPHRARNGETTYEHQHD